MKLSLKPFAAVAIAMLLSACGGGDGGEETAPTTAEVPSESSESSTPTTLRAVTDLDKAKLAMLTRNDFPLDAEVASEGSEAVDPTASDASDQCLGIAQTKKAITADVKSNTYTRGNLSMFNNVVVTKTTADVAALNRAQNSLVDKTCFVSDPQFAASILSVGPVPGFPRTDQEVSVRITAQAADGKTIYLDTLGTTVGRFSSSITITTLDAPLEESRQKAVLDNLRKRLLAASSGEAPTAS